MTRKDDDIINKISKVDRKKLGSDIPIEIFRVFRHFSQIYAEDLLGKKATGILFINAGKELGKNVGKKLYDKDLEKYIKNVKEFVEKEKIGILKVVEASNKKLVFQLDECITCAGMDNIGKRICFFEVGFVAGVVEVFLGKKVIAEETKCNANGEGVCEVSVYLNK
ncbi:MAG: 4-vinyl reductase [Persephonella sp.]|nr:MAG: 4-vinyl reductase [Persephonella sp.]